MEEEHPLNPKAEKMKKGTSMVELPNVILIDILSRLPFKSIMQSKLVCKSFDYLISRDSEFSHLHLSMSLPELILCTPNLEKLLIVDSDTDRAYELNLPMGDMELVNSCRGLLCLRPRYVTEHIRILNPVTLEFHIIPNPSIPPIERENHGVRCAGLGYSTITNQYKVLMFLMTLDSDGKECFFTLIHTLGTPVWRRLPFCPMLELTDLFSVFFNGNLHWIMNERDAEYSYSSMTSFDFNTEEFTETKLPPPFSLSKSRSDREFVNVLSLSVFEGFLTICLLDEDRSIHVWMMTKSSTKPQRWSLKMIINTVPFFVAEHIKYSFPVKFIIINNEPSSLVYVIDNVLMTNNVTSYDKKFWMTKNEGVKRLIFSCENLLSRAFMHDPILLPLNELLGGVKVHSLQPTGRKVWRIQERT